jgi:uncharacterized membrane protein (DUF4010 family)
VIDAAPLLRLAMSLAVGLLIGIERGWHERDAAEGTRAAGIRTFALVGLLGGIAAELRDLAGAAAFVAGFVAVAGFAVAAYVRAAVVPEGRSITSHVALLIAYALGAVAATGELALAASAAVVTALLLGLKPAMHGWLRRISETELLAGLKLLVISVVLLPVLPDRGFGPWEALNPYRIWWMVVLIAGTSFLGYAAARLLGPRRGILVAGACGGLASSTAVSLSFARFARREPERAPLYAGGILLASAIMMPRLLVVIAVTAPGFVGTVAAPLLGAFIGLGAMTALVLHRQRDHAPGAGDAALGLVGNPLELGTAVRFGLLLAVIMLLAQALNAWAGSRGVVLLAAISGLADVDAVGLSLSHMAGAQIAPVVAAAGVLAAVLVNTLTKATIMAGIGGRPMWAYAALGVAAALAGGVAGLAVSPIGLLFSP